VPTPAIIDGIRILMYLNDHDPPHFHVRKAEQRAEIEIATGRLMQGQLARGTMRKVEAWRALNQSALQAAWMSLRNRTTMN
jgi:hypothetical protein